MKLLKLLELIETSIALLNDEEWLESLMDPCDSDDIEFFFSKLFSKSCRRLSCSSSKSWSILEAASPKDKNSWWFLRPPYWTICLIFLISSICWSSISCWSKDESPKNGRSLLLTGVDWTCWYSKRLTSFLNKSGWRISFMLSLASVWLSLELPSWTATKDSSSLSMSSLI